MSRVNARWRRARQFNRVMVRDWEFRNGRFRPRRRWTIPLTITLPEFDREALSLALFGSTSTAEPRP